MTEQVIEQTIREAYGRLVSILAARSHDIMAAEDALQEALAAALNQWPQDGIPTRPEAWLITVAKRKLLDQQRQDQNRQRLQQWLDLPTEDSPELQQEYPFQDDRLELMLVCSHPAIDRAVHAPLILQTILGLSAERIAAAFLISPTSMSQRLVRAKQKILTAGLRFELPGEEVLEARLESLLDAIYAAYGTGWEDFTSTGSGQGLDREALLLCKAVLERLPDHPETLGLYALMRYTDARARARRDEKGRYVPLADQDIWLWNREAIEDAEKALRQAASRQELGRFQLEAAIQSAHVTARLSGQPNPGAVLYLYQALLTIAPSTGARVAHAVATADVLGAQQGLDTLEAIDPEKSRHYQAFHAVRAELLSRLDRKEEARKAYLLAIGASQDPAVRAYLQEKMQVLR